MSKEGFIAEMQYRIDQAREELKEVGDTAFDEDRLPSPDEWSRMDELRDRIQGYEELVNHFKPMAKAPEPFPTLLH